MTLIKIEYLLIIIIALLLYIIYLIKMSNRGFENRTKCLEDIPAVIEFNEDQTAINIYPNSPIHSSKDSVAVVLKIFNPRKLGLYQFQAYAQEFDDVPISSYVGYWTLVIDKK